MADREFVFSNPAIQKLIREKFVPLAMNDWYLRRQQDAEGQFFMEMTKASPRGNAGQSTRQGRYAFTATGKFLGFNNNRSPERILAMLNEALKQWEALPAGQRQLSAAPSAGKMDERFYRKPPQDGAVIKVYTRVLEKAKGGAYQKCTPPPQKEGSFEHHGFGAAVDHLWLQKSEVAELAKLSGSADKVALPKRISHRIARYHLLDNTRGEPPPWQPAEIKSAELFLVRDAGGKLRIEGAFHMQTADGLRGFEGRAAGRIEFQGEKLKAWELVVLGDNWGEGTYTPGARKGRNPIGFSLSLIEQPGPADSIAPQFSHFLKGYWESDQP